MSRVEFFKPMLQPGSGSWASRDIAQNGEITVDETDLAEMFRAAIDGSLTLDELRDWANLVLFNDAFDFEGEDLRGALDRIEESDEPGSELDATELRALLTAVEEGAR